MAGKIKRSTFILCLSLALNLLLFTFWWNRSRQVKDAFQSNELPMPPRKSPAAQEKLKNARLTNVIIPLHPRQEGTLIRSFRLWNRFLPCDVKNTLSHSGPGTNVTLTLFISSKKDTALEQRLLKGFHQISKAARSCFREVNVRHASLTGDYNNYLTGSRKMFEQMLNGSLNLGNASYALYMEPDLIPVRTGWLSAIDSHTRYPNLNFWLKGSVFRGPTSAYRNRAIYNLFHINGNAIYNLDDEDFRHFYFGQVRPYIEAHYTDGAYDTDLYKFLLDPRNYHWARKWAHKFQFTDAIRNMWHANYSLAQLMKESETVVLVHGGTLNL